MYDDVGLTSSSKFPNLTWRKAMAVLIEDKYFSNTYSGISHILKNYLKHIWSEEGNS